MSTILRALLVLCLCLLAGGHAPIERAAQASTIASPIQLVLTGVSPEYTLSPGIRQSIVNIVQDVLQSNLDTALSFQDVTYAGTPLPCRRGGLSGTSLQAYNRWEAGYNAWNACAREQFASNPQLGLPAANSAVWAAGGTCPVPYVTGRDYSAGQFASVCNVRVGNSLSVNSCGCAVYMCKNNMPRPSLWCGLPGYEPGNSQHWMMAWDLVGSCARSLVPPTSYAGIGCLGDGMDSVALPLRISVNAPADLASSVQSYIVQALRNNLQDIVDAVRPQQTALLDANVAVGPYDPMYLADASPPTPRPSNRPVDGEVLREVPMQINIDDVAAEYLPNPSDQRAILDIVEGVIRENLDGSLDLVDVSYANDDGQTMLSTRTRRLRNSMYLPIDVTVRGPSGAIDNALPNLLEIAEEYREEIAARLRAHDFAAFKDVDVGYEARDMIDIASDTVVTTHPVQLLFNDVDVGYELSERDRESFIDYTKVLLEDDLDFSWDLIQVAHARRFERETMSPDLPLLVTVRGPVELSDKEALSYLLRKLRDRKRDLANHLQTLDRNAFRDVVLLIDSKDLPDIVAPTFVEDAVQTSEHRVQLLLDDVYPGYEMDAGARSSIVRYFEKLVKDNLSDLDDSLELVGIEYAGNMGYETERASIPLVVTVKGTAKASAKTPSYVMQVLEDNEVRFKGFLSSLNSDVFDGASVYMEYDAITEPFTGTKQTEHPVQINIKNAPFGYRLAASDRASIANFVKDLLDDELNPSFELVDVAYAANSGDQSLSLLVTIQGPSEMSYFALADVMRVLNDHSRDIEAHIKSLDRDQLGNILISVELDDDIPSPSSSAGYQPPSPTVVYNPPSWTNVYQPAGDEEGNKEETIHPIRLKIDNVPSSYRLSPMDRESFIGFLEERVGNSLESPWELTNVVYAGSLVQEGRRYLRSETLPLPILVSVRGPPDTADLALLRLFEAILDNIPVIELYLERLNGSAFKNARVSIDTFDLNEVSNEPMSEEDRNTPDWVWWFLIATTTLFFLCCFCICFAGCIWEYRKYKESQRIEEKKAVKRKKEKKSVLRSSNRVDPPPRVTWAPVPTTTTLVPYNPLQIAAQPGPNNQSHQVVEAEPRVDLPRLMAVNNHNADDTSSTSSNSSSSYTLSEEESAIVVPSDTTSMKTVVSELTCGEDPPQADPRHIMDHDESCISSVAPWVAPLRREELHDNDDGWSNVSSVVPGEAHPREAHSYSTQSLPQAPRSAYKWNEERSIEKQTASVTSDTESETGSVGSTEQVRRGDNGIAQSDKKRRHSTASNSIASSLSGSVASPNTRRLSSTSTQTMHLDDLPEDIQEILNGQQVSSTRTFDLDDFPDKIREILSRADETDRPEGQKDSDSIASPPSVVHSVSSVPSEKKEKKKLRKAESGPEQFRRSMSVMKAASGYSDDDDLIYGQSKSFHCA